MKSSLNGIRRRVESLHRTVAAVCKGPHTFHRYDHAAYGARSEAWPAPDAPEHCACGRAMKYFRVSSQYDPAACSATALRTPEAVMPPRFVSF